MANNYDDYSEGYKQGYIDARKKYETPSSEWIYHSDNSFYYECYRCKEYNDKNKPFCPNCGAKMTWKAN